MQYNIKVVEVLKRIIDQFGIDILCDSDRCSNIFEDMAPKMQSERRLLQMVLSTEIYSILQNMSNQSAADTHIHLKRIQQELKDKFLDERKADIMINNIVAALGFNVFIEVTQDGDEAYNPLEKNISVKPYKFKGKAYRDVVSLLTALGKSWGEGKRELYDGKLSDFYKSDKNLELKQRINRAYQEMRQLPNVAVKASDAVFCKFLYDGIGPSQFMWRGQIYSCAEDLAKSIFVRLRSKDAKTANDGIEFFGTILQTNAISSYLRSCSALPLESIKRIEKIEKDYYHAQSEQKKVELLAECGIELMQRRYLYQGALVSTPNEIVQIILKNASGDFEKLDKIVKDIICENSITSAKVDIVLRAWLKLLGYEKQLKMFHV